MCGASHIDEVIRRLQELIDGHERIVFFGGAGVSTESGVPRCECGGMVRPDMVLFGEPLDRELLNRAGQTIRDADMLVVGGTSLAVRPAAGLPRYFQGDCKVIKEPTPQDGDAALGLRAPIAWVLAQIRVTSGADDISSNQASLPRQKTRMGDPVKPALGAELEANNALS